MKRPLEKSTSDSSDGESDTENKRKCLETSSKSSHDMNDDESSYSEVSRDTDSEDENLEEETRREIFMPENDLIPSNPERDQKNSRYSIDLANLKTNRMKLYNVQSLQNSCLDSVYNNEDYFFTKVDPFGCLPAAVYNILMDSVYIIPLTVNPKAMLLVINEKIETLVLTLTTDAGGELMQTSKWQRKTIDQLFSMIGQKCEKNLTYLDLNIDLDKTAVPDDPHPQPSRVQLNNMLCCLKNLTVLSLKQCGIRDDTLAVIGSTCSQLRSLDVANNEHVTDSGINFLCGMRKPYGRCLRLDTLLMHGTSISVQGVLIAISNLPLLDNISLHNEHIVLGRAMVEFITLYGTSKTLQLGCLKIKNPNSKIVEKLEDICKVLQSVKYLDINCGNLEPFLNLNNIVEDLVLNTCAPTTQVNSLVSYFGSSLTSFDCEGETTLDISILGHFCPNLGQVTTSCFIAPHCQYELLSSSFQNIYRIRILAKGANKFHLPSEILIKIFSSKRLGYFSLDGVYVPEHIVRSVLSEVRDKGEIFKKLQHIKLSSESKFSLDTWIELICLTPNLESINLNNTLNADEVMQLKQFSKKNDLDYLTITEENDD